MKPRLAVLVGAGASLEVGIPSTGDLLMVAVDALRNVALSDASVDVPIAITTSLMERCEEYFGKSFNFEQLMHVLEAIEALQYGLRATHPATSLPVEAMLTGVPHPKVEAALDSQFSFSAPRDLVRALHHRISETSKAAPKHQNWSDYANFWKFAISQFDACIGTLNYDSVVDQALDLGPQFQGFAPIPDENVWRLDERLLRACPRLMHLHGSIHLGCREYGTDANRFCYEDHWHDWYWHPTAESAARALNPGVSARQAGFRGYPMGPLITGYDKAEKLLMDPFGAYLRTFADCLRDTSRLLVVGYGFGDQHINALLQRMGKYHGEALRVAVITKFDPFYMHGSWGHARGTEATMYHRWGRDSNLLDQMNYSNPLCAKSGFLRVYYDGVVDTYRQHMAGLLEFLAG